MSYFDMPGQGAQSSRNLEGEALHMHVLVVGGGLSGLTLAQGLLKDGHDVDLYERDADQSRKIGYYLHMNADGGEALRRCLPDDLFALYQQTSRKSYTRLESIVFDDQLHELSSMPHLGPANDGPVPHTGVDRRTLRGILMARLGDSFHPGLSAAGYEEDADGVTLTLSDGSEVRGDVLVGADGIRSQIRRQRLPHMEVVEAGVDGLGIYGRAPLTQSLRSELAPELYEGVIIAADRRGSRMLVAAYQPRTEVAAAPAGIAPDVTLAPTPDFVMVSCSVPPGTEIPTYAEWTEETPAFLRDAMLQAVEGWHPSLRALVRNIDLPSIFVIPFGRLEPEPAWAPSRVTLIGDAAHAMLPTLGMGANLAMRDARHLVDHLARAERGETDVIEAIGAAEEEMREYAYPMMRMTVSHDKTFGGGGLVHAADSEAARG
jgi:2-polyprenyl-6-methoxyphenol hydroxylase-like FAD-dependent oxidoreductase